MICNNCGKENADQARFCAHCGNRIETAGQDSDLELLVRTLSPKYHIEKKIGQGGMAGVYLAEQTALERQVVVKILNTDMARDGEMRERFLREARTSARLKHPNIMDVVDVGVAEDRPFFIMEYISGGSLKELLQKARTEGRGIDPVEAIRLMIPVLRGLHFAHQQGVVHRDIKPENILIRGENDPVIADFGIAKVAGGTLKTQTGFTMGTVSYMSPEQCQGSEIDGRADIYSAGIMMYELLTGETPFQAENAVAVVNKHINESLPRLTKKLQTTAGMTSTGRFGPEVTRIRNLDSILEKACAKSPDKRYASAGEFANELAALIGETQTSSLSPALKWILAGTAAAVLLLGLGFGGYRIYRSMHDNIVIRTNPAGAKVFNAVTGVELGVTPFSTYEDRGGIEYKYRVSLADYRDEIFEIELKDPSVPAPAREVNLATNFALTSNPPGAKVFIDGQERGVTPRNIWLEPGKTYQIAVKKEGFVDVAFPLEVNGPDRIERPVQLYTPAQLQAAQPPQNAPAGRPVIRPGPIQDESQPGVRRGAIINE